MNDDVAGQRAARRRRKAADRAADERGRRCRRQRRPQRHLRTGGRDADDLEVQDRHHDTVRQNAVSSGGRAAVLTVISSAQARRGRRDDLVSAALAMAEASRRDLGCKSYGFYASLTDPHTIVCLEVWADRAALDRHMQHQHTRDFLASTRDLVSGTPAMAVLDDAD